MLRAFRAHLAHEARVAALEEAMVVQTSFECTIDEHVVRTRGRGRHAGRNEARSDDAPRPTTFTICTYFLFKSFIALMYAGVVGGCTGFNLTLVSSNA